VYRAPPYAKSIAIVHRDPHVFKANAASLPSWSIAAINPAAPKAHPAHVPTAHRVLVPVPPLVLLISIAAKLIAFKEVALVRPDAPPVKQVNAQKAAARNPMPPAIPAVNANPAAKAMPIAKNPPVLKSASTANSQPNAVSLVLATPQLAEMSASATQVLVFANRPLLATYIAIVHKANSAMMANVCAAAIPYIAARIRAAQPVRLATAKITHPELAPHHAPLSAIVQKDKPVLKISAQLALPPNTVAINLNYAHPALLVPTETTKPEPAPTNLDHVKLFAIA
jgi:hypothetical protein